MKIFITSVITLLVSFSSLVCFSAEHVVKMLSSGTEGSMIFEPSVLRIDVGDSVTFKATEPGHNAASISGLIPSGAVGWEGDINKDVTVKFDKEGVYVYQCTPHVVLAMVGVISVGKPANLQEVIANSANLQKSFVMHKDRLASYFTKLN